MKTSATISEIIHKRREDLQREMGEIPLNKLLDRLESNENIHRSTNSGIKNKSFKESINQEEDVAVICEFKPASPSKGHISDSKLEDAIEIFNKTGASAVSILTEERYFNGSLKNVEEARNITDLPILRKDFILNEYQIYQAKLAGASAVLLMNDIYPDIKQGISVCNELDIGYIVECKNKEDLKNSLEYGAEVVGINNRNFLNFTIDLKTTEKLAGCVPPEVVLVSESGVKDSEDAKKLAGYGVDAILVGTAIMGVKNKTDMYRSADNIIKSVKGSRIDRK